MSKPGEPPPYTVGHDAGQYPPPASATGGLYPAMEQQQVNPSAPIYHPPDQQYPGPTGPQYPAPGPAPGQYPGPMMQPAQTYPAGYQPVPTVPPPDHQYGPGQPQPMVVQQPVVVSSHQPSSHYYIPHIVLSCFVVWCCGFGCICGLIAFILAMVAMGSRASTTRSTQSARSLGIASLVLSIIGIVVSIIITICIVVYAVNQPKPHYKSSSFYND